MSVIHNQAGLGVRLSKLLARARGEPVEWDLSGYERLLSRVDARAAELSLASVADGRLRDLAAGLRGRAHDAEMDDHSLVEAFALAREASSRVLGMRHFDVQMIAGLALSRGRVVEMQTGEGKTLVAVLPAFVGSLVGGGVHVVTFNDYLARRDAQWMGDLYRFLGASTAHVVGGMTPSQRREAYRADITYLTAREMGYDLLRDSLVRDSAKRVLPPLNMAIIDEADSILIDEARVPLVLAGSDEDTADGDRDSIARVIAALVQGVHYDTDEGGRNAYLTDEGQIAVQEELRCTDLYDGFNDDLVTKLNQALHARALLIRDVDYVVVEGRVEIVDEFTGRKVPDRNWPDGLHRAVEAKEGLVVELQGRILNSISMQHLIDLYPSVCGMTGTVFPSEDELYRFYGLKTVPIPPNVPCVRVDRSDILLRTRSQRESAIVEEVVRENHKGRPILLGTASVEESQSLASLLEERGVHCNVLNASNDEREAEIVAQAGLPRAVTVSTNMAGRGTDIKLGGADESRRDEVVALGGLYVIGTSRFESRRVDDQLRGRAGRQGDPGESRFFVSLEDEMMKRFEVSRWIPRKLRNAGGEGPIEEKKIHDKIALTQRIVEGQNLDIRLTLWNYTSLVESQRRAAMDLREGVLEAGAADLVERLCPEKFAILQASIRTPILEEACRHIVLFHMDRAWSDHLANIADIREGIHLVRLGGRSPMQEYNRLAANSFEEMQRSMEDGVRESFEAAVITPDGIDLDREGLRGPTSTWTYLINDNPFEWLVGITAPGNIGLGIAAGLHGGLFVIWAVAKKIAARMRPEE